MEKNASNEANQILVDGSWTKMFYVYFYVEKIGPKMDPLSGARNHMGGPKDHEYISGVKFNF